MKFFTENQQREKREKRNSWIAELQRTWASYKVPRAHSEVLLEFLEKMDTDDLERCALAEIGSLESGQSPVQRIEKYFLMRESCLNKLFGLNEDFAGRDSDEPARQAIRAEARKRLCDLSKITLHFIEALAKWNALINSVAQAVGREPRVYEFCFDEESLDFFDMLFTDTAELAQKQVFAQEELPPDDLFFSKVLQAENRDAQAKHAESSEDARRRAW